MSDVTVGEGNHAASVSEPRDDDDASVTDPRVGLLSSLTRLGSRLGSSADRIHLETAYLVVALILGLVFMVLTPPFQTYDEPSHYQRAWSVAQGQFLGARDGTLALPRNVAELPKQLHYLEVLSLQEPIEARRLPGLLWVPISSEDVRVISTTSGYSPVGYLPQATGILVARALGHSPLLSLYLGRLVSLLVCLALVYTGLRIAPIGKPLLAVIALLPLTMTLMASVNQDGLVIAGWFLFVCLVLRGVSMETLGWRYVACLLGVFAVFAATKPAYCVLGLLVLALRPSQLRGKLRYGALVAAVLAIGAAITFGLSRLGVDEAHAEAYAAALTLPDDDPSGHLDLIIHHPLQYLTILKETFGANAVAFGRNMVGLLGWGNIFISDVALGVVAAILAVLLTQDERRIMGWWQRLVLLSTALLFVLAISTAFFLLTTPPGSSQIHGLQGRYFLPIVPVVLLALYGIRLKRPGAATSLVVLAALIGFVAAVSLLLRVFY